MFSREDWTLFRNLGTLSQKAGVPLSKIRRLVVKELVDNALDTGEKVKFTKKGPNTYSVWNDGAGIPGLAGEIARIFSVNRPLTSTKILRLPVRGALGNGLRVVVGAVLSTGGTLEVTTGGRRLVLKPRESDGGTDVVSSSPDDSPGTRVTVTFGPGLPPDPEDLSWARLAKAFAFAKTYKGKTSAWWYDSDSFFELLMSAGSRPCSELVGAFSEGAKLEDDIARKACDSFTRQEAEDLLAELRRDTKPIKPDAIGGVGGSASAAYRRELGVLTVKPGLGAISAELPFCVEAWAVSGDEDGIVGYVNGTPITGEFRLERQKHNKIAVFGCGLRHYVEGVSRRTCNVVLNVTTPYMPITTDGKEPDFSRYLEPIQKAISKATKKLKAVLKKESGAGSQTSIILDNLDAAIDQASGNGLYRYSLRQLFYAVRPFILESGLENADLSYGHFCGVITKYEAGRGELPGIYRDPRGNLYHPHLGHSVPVGTQAVEDYERPAWTFNKILYCEKEGFLNLLQSVGWPEQHDCALLSSKGFASRAVRDLLDLLGDTQEEIQFFCVHDADASGTLIYQALQESTPSRAARRVKIINLGLEPWEALDMGLQIEKFEVKSGRRLPVAAYVEEADDGRRWKQWLQGQRVELNAMTSPQFIAWLDGKMDRFSTGKVVPPNFVLKEQLRERTEQEVRARLTAQILDEANFAQKLAKEMAGRAKVLDMANLQDIVKEELEAKPKALWTDPLQKLAKKLSE